MRNSEFHFLILSLSKDEAGNTTKLTMRNVLTIPERLILSPSKDAANSA
jgi:hypothetical protein